MRAMRVRENAKSKSHRKTHQVEPGGTDRMFMDLTRGDLPYERAGEVSRGRSSEEARRKAGGAKGRRTSRGQLANGLRGEGEEPSETERDRQQRSVPELAKRPRAGGARQEAESRRASQNPWRKEAQEDA